MKRAVAILVLLCAAKAADAGIYRSPPGTVGFEFDGDGKPKALQPSQFALLYDDRINTMNPATPPERAKTRVETLKRIEQTHPAAAKLNPEEFLTLTADLIAVGDTSRALQLLLPRSRDRDPDFRIVANLVQAYALSGEWDAALRSYELFEDTQPPKGPHISSWRYGIEKKYTPIWLRYHRDMARNRPDATTLKPIPFFGDGPLPPDAVAIVQQMALDAPTDVFLLWALAETTARAGDYRTAATLFDKCTNNGLTQFKVLMARRAEVLDIVAKMPKLVETALLPSIDPPNPPVPPKGLFDLISPERFYPLAVGFALVALLLLGLQWRSIRRKRRRH